MECPILFNKTIEDLRRVGAKGGRAYARNCRARRQAVQPVALTPALAFVPPQETTAQAIATLDASFSWLKGVERRDGSRRPKSLRSSYSREPSMNFPV